MRGVPQAVLFPAVNDLERRDMQALIASPTDGTRPSPRPGGDQPDDLEDPDETVRQTFFRFFREILLSRSEWPWCF
jgi:hypothetical protein